MTEGDSTHLKLNLLFLHDIQAVSRYAERFKCGIFEWYLRYPRLQKTTAESLIYSEDSFCTLNSVTVGVPRSMVTGTVTKLLTALAGNLRWKLLS